MLSRCEEHGWPDKGSSKSTYVAEIEPAGYPNSAIVCGRCDRDGLIYLNRDEHYEYQYEDERIFSLKEEKIIRFRLSDEPNEVKDELIRDEGNPPEPNPDINSAADF